jgi:acyl-CoA thioester hydrolase
MGASVTIHRRLDWVDTDAAGYWHHSTFWKFAEAGEAALMRELGLTEVVFGHTPRRSVAAEFVRPVFFDDAVDIDVDVRDVGRTSATYGIAVAVDGDEVARGTMTVVHIGDDGRPAEWPEAVRDAFGG